MIQGCNFHFCQCIIRHIGQYGFKERYQNDTDFALSLRLLAAIAFVPIVKVDEAFEVVSSSGLIPAECQCILNYFEDTWIGRPQRRSNLRRRPTFLPELWSCYHAVQQKAPKTNNAVEA